MKHTSLYDYFPGMLASLITTDIRSTIPEVIAGSQAICGTFCNVTTDGTTKLNIGDTYEDDDTNLLGVILYNPNRIYSGNFANLENALIYTEGDPLTLLTQGDVVMVAEKAVNAGSQVQLRTVAEGAFTVPYKLTDTADVGTVALKGARFMESTSAAGLVVVHIDNVELGA